MFRMDAHFDRLLRGSDELPLGIWQLQKVTAEQLCKLHYGRSLTHVQALLKTLCEKGYVQYDGWPVKHITPKKIFYSTRYFYTLGPKGVEYLRKFGADVKPVDAPRPDQDSYPMFLKHHLELNDIVISAALSKRGFYLHNLRTQQELNEHPWRNRGGPLTKLVPDALLEFGRVGTNAYLPLLLEYDRYTEFGEGFNGKLRTYRNYLRERAYVDHLGVNSITVCLCTFKGEHRRDIMRECVQAEMRGTGLDSMFLFANLPQPPDDRVWLDPIWHTVEGEVHALLAM